MKIVSWNVRGINASDKRGKIHKFLESSKANIVLLHETKLSQETFQKSLAKWPRWSSVHFPSMGASGGLAILWKPFTIQGHLIQQQANWKMLQVLDFDVSFNLFNVYGPTSTEENLKTWDQLPMLIQSQNSHQVILGGDFNAILNQNEKIGGIFPPIKTIQDFAKFVENNDLMDNRPSNGKFKWKNGRSSFAQVAARLDKFFLS